MDRVNISSSVLSNIKMYIQMFLIKFFSLNLFFWGEGSDKPSSLPIKKFGKRICIE